MRHLFRTGISAASIATSAQIALAADLPRKAPIAPPPLVLSWTGFYLGVNFGYGAARDPDRTTQLANGIPGISERINLTPNGVLGGGQVGYNWQAWPNWVVGIEADLQASAQRDSHTCVTNCVLPGQFTQVSQKLPWFGTVRGRLGWTNGPTLFYATGGWAYGEVTTGATFNNGNIGIDSHSASQTKSGWTVGAGIETRLAGNWTAKAEYLYIDLGRVTETFVYTQLPILGYSESSTVHNHVIRVGVNYKWGDPIYARAAGAAGTAGVFNWSGFYLGGNFGYGVGHNPSASNIFLAGFPGVFRPETFNLSPHGVLGGGQIGYNWQASPNWVLGIEADIQGSGQSDSTTCVNTCGGAADFALISQKLPWFGTLRGRIGWSNGPALYYATGGWAYGRVTANYTAAVSPVGSIAQSVSDTQSGWTAGGGIETQVAGNWTAKVEYLYVDLGSVNHLIPANPGFTYAEPSDIRNHVFRVGVNYKFGSLY